MNRPDRNRPGKSFGDALGGPDTDFSEMFRPRHRDEAVSPNVHVEPTPRVPDYGEIGRLVGRPSDETSAHGAQPDEGDAGRRTAVPAR